LKDKLPAKTATGIVATAPAQVTPEKKEAAAPAPQIQTAAKEEPRASVDTLSLLDKAAQDYDLDPRILHAQARQESGLGLDNEAVSSKGARGVMQLMPRTAKSLGVDAHDTAQNVDGGARLMGQLRKRFGGRYDRALAAYDWSPDKVQAAIDTYGDKWLEHTPDETQKYVHNILRNAAQ
jgi:soluble lytic murein transglycosylase-like protein